LQDGKDRDQSAGHAKDGYDKDMQAEVDARSIYVGNVEYTVDSAELAEFFGVCCLPMLSLRFSCAMSKYGLGEVA
jgi:hypothetical protein